MKRMLTLMGAAVLVTWLAAADENGAAPRGTNVTTQATVAADKAAKAQAAAIGQTQPGKVRKNQRPPVQYGGAAVKAARSKKPWQILNPFAPANLGNGAENVVRDPVTGQVTGVSLISVEF